ncbi:MAG: class I SAM-dependent methyltransferase [Anaerolineales bacterium]|nr:class I SAM-dependent methyltransferase [Anaerolineales bacterium]
MKIPEMTFGAGWHLPHKTVPRQIPQKIELLSVDLLDENRSLVNDLKGLAKILELELGWHYLLDLSWIIRNLGTVTGKRIMDAGAGTGLMQWYLAQKGADVISVDRQSRAALPLRFRSYFHIRGLRAEDLLTPGQVLLQSLNKPKLLLKNLASLFQHPMLPPTTDLDLAGEAQPEQRSAAKRKSTRSEPGHLPPGNIWIYNQDLASLKDIEDDSIDAVVAVSALEHNPPQSLTSVVNELLRVLKPGGALLATLTASPEQDWWHEPSSGWCYSESSLQRLFDLPADTLSNYDQYAELFNDLRRCTELRDHLASFYFQSDKNGMPWGKWDPQYLPVGVCKVKPRIAPA